MARRGGKGGSWTGAGLLLLVLWGIFGGGDDDKPARTSNPTASQSSQTAAQPLSLLSSQVRRGAWPEPQQQTRSQARTGERSLYVTASSLNLRVGPSGSADVLEGLPNGSAVVELERGADWTKVRSVSGRTGWASSRYLSDQRPTAAAKSEKPQLPAIPQAAFSAVARALISESIASYPGNCPCPYNTDRAGRRCGQRSAHSKRGGYAPLCYESDVSEEMADKHRKRSR